jgi:hypothetical protein
MIKARVLSAVGHSERGEFRHSPTPVIPRFALRFGNYEDAKNDGETIECRRLWN